MWHTSHCFTHPPLYPSPSPPPPSLLSLSNCLHAIQGAHGLDGRPGPVVSGARPVPITPNPPSPPLSSLCSLLFCFCLSVCSRCCLLVVCISVFVLCCLMVKVLFRSLLRLYWHEYYFHMTLSLSQFGCPHSVFYKLPFRLFLNLSTHGCLRGSMAKRF